MTEIFLSRSSVVPLEVKSAVTPPEEVVPTAPSAVPITMPPEVIPTTAPVIPPSPVEVPPAPAVPWESIVIGVVIIGGLILIGAAVYFYGVGK